MSKAAYDIEVFHDGDCALCEREISWLRRLDRRSRIQFTDLAASGFEPPAGGPDRAGLMRRIHGRLPDGRWLEGVEVFRQLYAAVGLGWLVALTRLPGVRQLLDLGYETFAANRLRWTGRCEAGVCRTG